jgi:hypothetical protein
LCPEKLRLWLVVVTRVIDVLAPPPFPYAIVHAPRSDPTAGAIRKLSWQHPSLLPDPRFLLTQLPSAWDSLTTTIVFVTTKPETTTDDPGEAERS